MTDENFTPEDDDDYIGDATHGYSVMRGGKNLGTFTRESRAAAALYIAREQSQYWPNVWRVNDHGNVELCVFDSHVLRYTGIGYV